MRKPLTTILLTILLTVPMTIMAEGISEEQARQIAAKFWTPDGNGNSSSETRRATMRSAAAAMQLAYKSEANELYVLNKPEGGWCIVAGDDAAPAPVLGYSDRGIFDYDKIPDALRNLLLIYSAQITYLRETGDIASSTRVPRRNANIPSEVKPLLKTAWNQISPYNNDTPMGHFTGCVATAMAQIMNYHKWPKRGSGQHTNLNYPSQTVNFSESVYDWNNMPEIGMERTANSDKAVAKLMADVGCAVDMKYNYSGSSAYIRNAFVAFFKNFNYDEGTISNKWTDDDLLRQELAEGQPFIVSGCDTIRNGTKVIGLTASHAFVCDGYDAKGFFHYNFGWGGDYDGYYKSTAINPPRADLNGKGYSFNQEIIHGIQPASYTRVVADGIFYDIIDDKNVLIASSNGAPAYEGKLVLPSTVTIEGKQYNVSDIRPTAFVERIDENNIRAKCTAVTGLVFEVPMDSLPTATLSDMNGLESITIKNVRKVSDKIFRDLNKLSDVRFGEGIEEIGRFAFYNSSDYSNNKELYLYPFPTSLRRIDRSAFDGEYRPHLAGVHFLGKGFVIEGNGLASYTRFIADGLEYAIKIGENGAGPLTGDVIISPVCQYAKNAISGKFDHIILPASLTNFDVDMFGFGTTAAEYVVKKDNPNYASANGLLFNKDMTTLIAYPCYEFASSTRDIIVRDLAFVPAGVKTISRRAFAPGPTLITIPASVKELDGAFTDCTTMRELTVMSTTPPAINDDNTFPDNINDEYRPCKLIVPHGSKAAYQQANGWKNFENIIESDLYVQGQLCYTVSGDQWATIEGRNANADFDGNLFIPATVTIEGVNRQIDDINLNAFTGDLQLKTVTFSKNLESWAQFTGCDKLYAIHVEEGNSLIHSTDGMLFANIGSDQRYTLVFCPPMKQEGSSIVERSQVVIPDGTQHIVADAFTPTLRRVTIPASVEEIEENAFGKCNHLKTIICKGINPPCFNEGDSPFPTNLYLTATLYIPKGSLDNYKQGWPYGMFSNFENIVEYDPATFDPNSIDDGPEDAEPADPEFPDPNDYLIDEPDEPGEPDEPVIQDAVAVYRINGQVEYFAFDGRPTITYEGDNLVMTCGGNCVQYTLKGLEKITFTTIATGIGNLPELKQLTFSFSDDRIDIAGAKADEPVRIYDTTGRMVDMLYTDGEGRQTISFSPMQKGVYIIQIGNTSYKILKK